MLASLCIVLSLVAALLLRGVGAQCTVYGSCDHYIVPENPPDGVDCIIDPNDSASIEVEFAACPCSTATAFGTIIYFSNDGSEGTATAITPSALVSSSDQFPTLSFDVPYSDLGAEGAPVTVIAGYVEAGTTVSGTWHYTMFAESTIVYSTTTTSITTPVYTTTTTTATDTEVDVTVFPGSTVTSKCSTGTNTVTTKPSTTTTTVTSTPATKTISKTVLSTTTTTLSCVPGEVSTVAKRRRSALATANVNNLMPRQAGGTYEFPQCIQTPISTTTIYTSTVVSTFSTTSTITAIAYTTTTSYTSSTMSPQTVCNHASATVVITPTTTKTATTHLSTPVTTTSFTVGVTKTVVPTGLPACTVVS